MTFLIVKYLISLVIGAVVISWVMMGPLDMYLTNSEIEEVLKNNLD